MTRRLDRLDALRDPSGRLTRPLRSHWLCVPKSVRLDGTTLRFAWPNRLSLTEVPANLLETFLEIDTTAKTLAFARRFGPLLLDGGGGASLHHAMLERGRQLAFDDLDPENENIASWERTVQIFRAVLQLAVSLREEQRPDLNALVQLERLGMQGVDVGELDDEWEGGSWEKLDVRSQRFAAATDLQHLLMMLTDLCELRPTVQVVDWNAPRMRFELQFQDAIGEKVTLAHHETTYHLGALSLFGALLTQLLATCTGTGFASCAACGRPFVPTRKPRAGEHHYCARCGRPAA